MAKETTIIAGGDTSPANVDPPSETFTEMESLLQEADITFAQVERILSERGESFRLDAHSRVAPETVAAYTEVDFDVVGLASNHTFDYGASALEDTLETFRDHEIATIGAGSNLSEASEPVIFERNGTSIAMLAFCSVLLPGYWATDKKPGIAPARAHTYYEAYEYQPGSPARVVTESYEEDIQNVVNQVEAAAQKADYVITSFHWGNHFYPGHVCQYQQEYAHAAIDAGCDLVFGHHAHIPLGVEVYEDAPILYSLGDFAKSSQLHIEGDVDLEGGGWGVVPPEERYTFQDAYGFEAGPDTRYLYREHTGKSVVAKFTLNANGQGIEASLIPITLENSRPRRVEESDSHFHDVLEFMEWSSKVPNSPDIPAFDTQFDVSESEIKILH